MMEICIIYKRIIIYYEIPVDLLITWITYKSYMLKFELCIALLIFKIDNISKLQWIGYYYQIHSFRNI